MNRLLDIWKTLLSFSKYILSNTFSQNIDNCSVAFSLLFSILIYMMCVCCIVYGKQISQLLIAMFGVCLILYC